MSSLRGHWAHIPETSGLVALDKLPTPDPNDVCSEVRYADDLYAFVLRSDANIRMFFLICALCALGSGTENNMTKTMVHLIGVNRRRDSWPL
eukprot:SAG31_NODE_30200_length_384_cov_0.905263_1_plen_91_part_10